MATNYSSSQYTFYLHKGLPALHLGAPADLFDTRRLVSGCWPGCFGCRRSFSGCRLGCFGCRQSFSGCRQGAFCYRRAVARHSAHKLSLPSTKSAFLCAFCLRNPCFRAFRAQNRGFCALFAFRTPVFGLFEHKIVVFVRFLPSEPPFSGFSSTKSMFLCSGRLGLAPGSATVAFQQITVHASKMQMSHNQTINF